MRLQALRTIGRIYVRVAKQARHWAVFTFQTWGWINWAIYELDLAQKLTCFLSFRIVSSWKMRRDTACDRKLRAGFPNKFLKSENMKMLMPFSLIAYSRLLWTTDMHRAPEPGKVTWRCCTSGHWRCLVRPDILLHMGFSSHLTLLWEQEEKNLTPRAFQHTEDCFEIKPSSAPRQQSKKNLLSDWGKFTVLIEPGNDHAGASVQQGS